MQTTNRMVSFLRYPSFPPQSVGTQSHRRHRFHTVGALCTSSDPVFAHPKQQARAGSGELFFLSVLPVPSVWLLEF